MAAPASDRGCLAVIDSEVIDLTQPYTQPAAPDSEGSDTPQQSQQQLSPHPLSPTAGQKRTREAVPLGFSGCSVEKPKPSEEASLSVPRMPRLSGSGGPYFGGKTCARVAQGAASTDLPLAKALWRDSERPREVSVKSEDRSWEVSSSLALHSLDGRPPLPSRQPCTPQPPQGSQGSCGYRDPAAKGAAESQEDQASSQPEPQPASQKVKAERGSEVQLSDEQQRAVEAALAGKNLFITGKAGVGKSLLVQEMVKRLQEETDRLVHVTASTGIAAVNIGGCTVHSFAGIQKGDKDVATLIQIVKNTPEALLRWQTAGVLVIDEVSMISEDLFEKLERIARWTRGFHVPGRPTHLHPQPFGGIQVICVGDFLQLPPVSKGYPKERFAFESPRWKACKFNPVLLTKIFRQSDSAFINVLNEVRIGRPSRATLSLLYGLRRPLSAADGIKPTVLYPCRKDVNRENQIEFGKLPGAECTFHSYDFFSHTKHQNLLNDCQAPPYLRLKIGAQVMMLHNMNFTREIVNGSRGVVVGFVRTDQHLFDTAAEGSPNPSCASPADSPQQSPKPKLQHDQPQPAGPSQCSDQTVTMHQEPPFRNCNHKAAWGPRPSPSGSTPRRPQPTQSSGTSTQSEPKKHCTQTFTEIWMRHHSHLPVVRFTNGEEAVIHPHAWTVEKGETVVASRTQCPLMLAWAVTVHKSQGLTMDRVRLNLDRVFEHGMSYVALSRCKSLEGMQLEEFRADKISAAPRVLQFHAELEQQVRNIAMGKHRWDDVEGCPRAAVEASPQFQETKETADMAVRECFRVAADMQDDQRPDCESRKGFALRSLLLTTLKVAHEEGGAALPEGLKAQMESLVQAMEGLDAD